MNTALGQMLKAYNSENLFERKNAVKEIMQEIVLCGLSRAGFFKKAAFYGGTALRIFYGLDRFSEDLDFSLETADPAFDLKEYFPALEKEVRSYGLKVEITEREKTVDSHIRSAFLKGNTREHMLLFYDSSIPGMNLSRLNSRWMLILRNMQRLNTNTDCFRHRTRSTCTICRLSLRGRYMPYWQEHGEPG